MTEGTKKAAIAMVGLASGVFLFWLWGVVFDTGGDDDQPPVVVSSGGSAVFEAQDNGLGHGAWVPNGEKQVWYDSKGNGNFPQKFAVRLYNLADAQPAECGKSFKNVLALQGTLSSTSQFSVSVAGTGSNRRLTVDAVTDGAEDKFTVSGYVAHYGPSAAYLTSVLVNGVTCNFKNQDGRFIIVQLH